MKPLKPLFYSLFLFLIIATQKLDAQIKAEPKYYTESLDPEIVAKFPGGPSAFSKFVLKNLKYPEVAALVGLTGKVYVRFIVTKKGFVRKVEPVRCLGAGCESEAVRVISLSPRWIPGTLGGKPNDIQLVVPISFNLPTERIKTYFKDLKNSAYNFVFFMKGKTYSLNDAQAMLGNSFNPKAIEIVEEYDNPHYSMPGKKGVYLVIMKG